MSKEIRQLNSKKLVYIYKHVNNQIHVFVFHNLKDQNKLTLVIILHMNKLD